MAIIIDRRLNPSGKSIVNRQRFIDRAKSKIKEAIQKSVTDNNIKDISDGKGGNITIKSKDVSEPRFTNDPSTGTYRRALPGNKEYNRGDTVPKPKGSGKGNGEGEGGEGDSLDEFQFTLTRDEFLDCLFEDLELPDFIKESLKNSKVEQISRAGFTNSGSPANLNLVRTFKNSIGRRLALRRPTDEEIEDLEVEIKAAEIEGNTGTVEHLKQKLEDLLKRRKVVPYIEEHDLRYNLWQRNPNPQSQAVMFCLMDVSGSMGDREKDISKRFFLILYLFLERKYDTVQIRFIRHTETAEEVDEHTFFYDRQSGGTRISSGLKLISDIIDQEYPVNDWNIYIAQCTDGDNTTADNNECDGIIREKLQPVVQYFAYIQVNEYDRNGFMFGFSAWSLYYKLSQEFSNIISKRVIDKSRVWTVFRELFSK